jgi:Guanine nucleotide exchange factor synembryn
MQHPSLTMQFASALSLLFYQMSGPANPAARVAGFIIQVITSYSHPFALCFDGTFADALLALSTAKALGRQPSGSSVIASASNLSTLLAVSKSFKDSNLEASLEALRCIANALLLIESARSTLLSDAVGGGEYALLLLEVS